MRANLIYMITAITERKNGIEPNLFLKNDFLNMINILFYKDKSI